MKRILIISNFFYPEITPRAFRVKELAIGFCKRGYQVDLLLPNKEIYKKNSLNVINGLNIIFANEPQVNNVYKNNLDKNSEKNGTSFKLRVLKQIKDFFYYFFPREIYQTYNKGITKVLKKNSKDYLAVISISQPLSIHMSVMISLVTNKKLRKAISIAEFSDPLFRGSVREVFPLNYLYGFFFSWFFNHFVVPIEQAKIKFNAFKKNNVHIIPQGFNFSDLKLKEYKKNNVTTFAYAGNFYNKLRDPTYFLNALTKVDSNFVFRLYLSKNNIFFRELISGYQKKIKGTIEILDFIPREELIYELSTVDFLINFDNENESMSPSKLIDYALTDRPILSFNSKSFKFEKLNEFLNFKFFNQIIIDTKQYDIDEILNKYERIIKCNKKD